MLKNLSVNNHSLCDFLVEADRVDLYLILIIYHLGYSLIRIFHGQGPLMKLIWKAGFIYTAILYIDNTMNAFILKIY